MSESIIENILVLRYGKEVTITRIFKSPLIKLIYCLLICIANLLNIAVFFKA